VKVSSLRALGRSLPLGRSAPQDDDLLTQGQIFGFKRRS
jgi:hypothetical protein